MIMNETKTNNGKLIAAIVAFAMIVCAIAAIMPANSTDAVGTIEVPEDATPLASIDANTTFEAGKAYTIDTEIVLEAITLKDLPDNSAIYFPQCHTATIVIEDKTAQGKQTKTS